MYDHKKVRKRNDRKIASASVALMSDTKWRKLFVVLREFSPPLPEVQWKFVNEERVHVAEIPRDLMEKGFGDVLPSPYGLYKDIEWIFIPESFTDPRQDEKRPLPTKKNDLVAILNALENAGQFPLEKLEDGVKIVGYKW